jgi:hypothetical protein
MTKNAFIFSWDYNGIEAIIPISIYENQDKENLIKLLKGEESIPNPLNSIIRNLIIRARFNHQRFYEIYAVDCDESLDENFWKNQWQEHPQLTADLIRERGHKIYSDRQTKTAVII